MLTLLLRHVFSLMLLIASVPCFSQERGTVRDIENALTSSKFDRADKLLRAQTDFYFSLQKFDSLPQYASYIGRVAEKKSGAEYAITEVDIFLKKLKSQGAGGAVMADAFNNAAEFYGTVGKNEQAFKGNQDAYNYAIATPGFNAAKLGAIHSDLGTYAYRMGNISLAKSHHRNAIAIFLRTKTPDYDRLYTAANNMGASMWFDSKMDSAVYYYDIAYKALSNTERNPLNQYYRPAVLQNNIAALYGMQGKTSEAIKAMTVTIENLRKYLSIKEDLPKKETAITFQFEATDNLAGIYKELGDYSRAHELLTYSYKQKQKYSGADKTGLFKSEILIGQLYLAMKEYDKAFGYLQRGLHEISKADGDYLFWQADAAYSLALLHDERGEDEVAHGYYEKADSLYEASLQGEYDDIYLEFLRNSALFHAENGRAVLALQKGNKGLQYISKTQGRQTIMGFYHLLNLGEIHFQSGNYTKAIEFADKGLQVVNSIMSAGNSLLDSIKTELKKPKAILLKTKAEYRLLSKKDKNSLKGLLNQVNEALNILEKRRAIIHDPADISLMMADHADLVGFVKTLTLELHQLTPSQGYMDKLIELHESGIYHRIRSRLDKNDLLQFTNVPSNIQGREKQLKQEIKSSLEGGYSHSESMRRYFAAIERWNEYMDMIRKNYPKYYEMRYASIFKSLSGVQESLEPRSTVIRYFFIDKELFALVMTSGNKQLVRLAANDLEKNIRQLDEKANSAVQMGEVLYTLYQQLWQPIRKFIVHRKVIIIPDGILYNLSFDILTPKKISQYEELATSSLLAEHAISYHYSLYLASQDKNERKLMKSFVAFAPGFLDEEKGRYLSTIKDSNNLDHSYVRLLPQPFTIDLAGKARNMLGGVAYLKERSTAESFKMNAGQHKIIHIGTHAESNNLYPEYTRLIFSKNVEGEPSSNSVFLHEIYNCNLNSELAVLTACETGKPGYEDGEGMISLAHAFNYAGSESILTGLWKIDEKASSMLVELFYENLLEGMDKDEALRMAKLSYLSQAKGRMLAPAYWSGLILMGNTDPIELEKKNAAGLWIVLVIGLAFLIGSFLVRRRLFEWN